MAVYSEKLLYNDAFEEICRKYEQCVFLWGEDLMDKRLFVYSKKIKDIPDYVTFAKRLTDCGLITVNPMKERALTGTSVRYDELTKTIYISEDNFNALWRFLRKSVALGIRLARKKDAECLIGSPEDIVVLENLQRAGSTPVLENNRIVYKERVRSSEEMRLISARQSALDNQKNVYFYAKTGGYVHDRLCNRVREIPLAEFAASGTFPEGREYCPHCGRQLFIRIGCAPNAKEIPVCDRIFTQRGVKTAPIRRFVMEEGMHFHAKTLSEMTVTHKEDTWIIKMDGSRPKLWHNNYVRISPTERYITQGFHKQKTDKGSSLYQLLSYITNYSWQKHLDAESAKLEEEVVSVPIAENITEKPSLWMRVVAYVKRMFLGGA